MKGLAMEDTFELTDMGNENECEGESLVDEHIGWEEDIEECFEGINPEAPTMARPGSAMKTLVLAARYEAGLPLWHEGDRDDFGTSPDETDSRPAVPLKKGGRKKRVGDHYRTRAKEADAPQRAEPPADDAASAREAAMHQNRRQPDMSPAEYEAALEKLAASGVIQ